MTPQSVLTTQVFHLVDLHDDVIDLNVVSGEVDAVAVTCISPRTREVATAVIEDPLDALLLAQKLMAWADAIRARREAGNR